MLIPWLALRLGRPVKWIEDRSENFLATTQERGQIHDAEIALDRGGRILGVRDDFLHDTGAYDPYGLTVPINSQCTLLGPYRVPAYQSEFRALPLVAHPQIRNRGTIGGSLAHADPAAELPAVAIALGARLHAASTRGERTFARTVR